jgi:hypothetical protein
VLEIAILLLPAAPAEVQRLDVVVAGQLRGRALEHDAPALEDAAVVRDREREVGVLLDEQQRGLRR